ncbi:MAG: acetolactate decarboxylase [Acidobacteriota bacterium]
MRKTTLLLIVLLLSAVMISAAGDKVVTQASTVNAVLKGMYDGTITFGDLKKYGDFGIGYFDKMGGEALAVDGIFYRIKSDGLTEVIKDVDKTPFFTVTKFESDTDNFTNRKFDLKGLKDYLLGMMPRKKSFYAIKITGIFDNLNARTFLRQGKPYPDVDQVLETQTEANFTNTEGILIGFYTPEFLEGIAVPGFHFHYLSKDKTRGGHVISLNVNSITIEFFEISRFQILFPDNADYQSADLGITKKIRKELQKFEKQ